MRKIWNKGHRIRASDKHLVYHFSIGTLLFLFVAVLLLLNIKQLMRTDWEHFILLEKGLLHIRCEITLGKYQDQLLRLEDKLESGLYCELTDKTLYDGHIEYTLLYDMIANRITIDEVRAENGCLRLMKNLVWEKSCLGI